MSRKQAAPSAVPAGDLEGQTQAQRTNAMTGLKGWMSKSSSATYGRGALGSLSGAILMVSATASIAQVELKTYADDKGYISVRALTCAQLAGTFQEDADFLGVWYSGWLNGNNKKHMINVRRTKEGIHNVIVYCKANPERKSSKRSRQFSAVPDDRRGAE